MIITASHSRKNRIVVDYPHSICRRYIVTLKSVRITTNTDIRHVRYVEFICEPIYAVQIRSKNLLL